MLSRRKNVVVTGLFVLGACGFVLGFVPDFAPVFWVLWFTGCGASILGLILAATVPRPDRASDHLAGSGAASPRASHPRALAEAPPGARSRVHRASAADSDRPGADPFSLRR